MNNPKLQVTGNVEIKCVEEPYRLSGFKRESITTYYAVVSAEIGGLLSDEKINVEVPVSKQVYDTLKELLSSSKAELPQLKISGDLEIRISVVSIN